MASKKKNPEIEATVKDGETIVSAADVKELGSIALDALKDLATQEEAVKQIQTLGVELGIAPADSSAFVEAVTTFTVTEPATLEEAIRLLFPFLGIEDEKEVKEIHITALGAVRVFRTNNSMRSHRFTPFEREEPKWVR